MGGGGVQALQHFPGIESIVVPDVDLVRGTEMEAEQQAWAELFGDETGEMFKKASPAGWNHLMHSCSNEIPIWKDGKFDSIPAWDSGEYVDFAEPMGRFPVFYVGHSEPLHPPVMPDKPLWQTPDSWKDLGCYQGQAVIGEGIKDGKKMRVTNRYMCSIFDRGSYTFAGQAIGIYLLGNMKNKPKGVFAPEGLLDTKEFFDTLVKLTNSMNGWNLSLEEFGPTEIEVLE